MILWQSLKNKNDSEKFLVYFPDYGPKVLPSNLFTFILLIFLRQNLSYECC